VMQWHNPESLLIIANQNNINNAFELTVNLQEQRAVIAKKLNISNVEWIQYTDKNEIVYVDLSRDVWMKSQQSTSDKASKIEVLVNQVGNRRLTLRDGLLYGINNQKQLWRYQLNKQQLNNQQLNSQRFTLLKQLPASARYISDFNKDKALITQTLRHDKEIIELY